MAYTETGSSQVWHGIWGTFSAFIPHVICRNHSRSYLWQPHWGGRLRTMGIWHSQSKIVGLIPCDPIIWYLHISTTVSLSSSAWPGCHYFSPNSFPMIASAINGHLSKARYSYFTVLTDPSHYNATKLPLNTDLVSYCTLYKLHPLATTLCT